MYFLSHCQYQNKKALFTDPIFSEGFGASFDEQVFTSSIRFFFFFAERTSIQHAKIDLRNNQIGFAF